MNSFVQVLIINYLNIPSAMIGLGKQLWEIILLLTVIHSFLLLEKVIHPHSLLCELQCLLCQGSFPAPLTMGLVGHVTCFDQRNMRYDVYQQ